MGNQAIRTRRGEGGRAWIARSSGGVSVHVARDYSVDADEMHLKAAVALCEKLNWTGTLRRGDFGGDCYWVMDTVEEGYTFAVVRKCPGCLPKPNLMRPIEDYCTDCTRLLTTEVKK